MPTLSTKPGPEVGLEEEEECTFPCWRTLPDHIVLHIFSFLGASTLAKTGLVCKAWLRVAFDELLWKDLFYRHWGISRSIPMAPGKYSWIQEYKRLLYHTPSVESEVLKQHADQVLHVSFSHNGKMFATCSKDGFIRVWDATYPTSIKFKADMRKFTWKYTQFSQFNSTDTLLLVSGVHFGSLSTSGEIAVFSLEGEFVMQSRVMNKPYDVFGTWYNDYYLLSGNLHWTGHLNSCSAIWLNKAYQETMSEEESVVMRLFKFSNINASSIRTIMIANCLSKETDIPSGEDKSTAEDVDGSSIVLPPMIGDLITNQEEEDSNEQAEEPNDAEKGKEEMDPNRMEKKTSKSLQRMQVFENGEFITKFLEVDADEPNNKLNGTIEYSSDYRLAEGPKSHTKKGIHGDTSGSELSTNGNHSSSEVSSMNGSSDVFDQSHSSLDVDMGAKSSRSDIEDSQSEQMLSVRRQSRQPSPNESEHVQFMLADVAPLATEEKLDLLVLGQRYDQGPLGSKLERLSQWSVESQLVQSQSVEFNDFSSEDLSTCQSHPSGLANTSTETITGEPLETPSERIAETASEAAGYKSSPKRVLHGQQQQHGELFRNPSTCEVECKTEAHPCSGTPSSSSDSLELPEKTPRLAFCCVDYKKQKKNESLRHTQSRNASSDRYSKTKSCLGRDFVETVKDMSVSEEKGDCVQSKSDNSSRNLQSRMCLGRQSVETIEDEPGSEVKMENGQCRAQSKISTNEENQSGSDVGIDCVPGRVQSRICAGIGTASTENMEYQSSDNDIKVKCKPVRNTCSMQSDTTSVTLSSSSSQSKVYKSAGSGTKFQYKTKKSKKGKSRKIKDKYLIFTKGSETYTPHQIGIKRIKPFQAFSDDGSRLLPNVSENTHQLDRENDIYDEVDHLIDMHGHIIGMTLSPDHRYLYVNSRPWPKNYHIENPLYPPPIAQEIDIHVIDLLNMREVGTMHRAHKAYTSNDECFFIFLDVCEEYVASGAEDKHGYLWDRHYGLCLHKYPHTDVVNSVAFNPADPEVLVTVSDDFSIKIWRSLSREKEVVKAFNKEHSIRVKHVQALMSDTSEYDENVFGGEEKT